MEDEAWLQRLLKARLKTLATDTQTPR
jgi:hypothetical protein